jgi:pimeloyl-ACP methyl ester carboxylesterase
MRERRTRIGPHRVRSLHEGKGSPVVLLHGLAGSARWWQATVPALAARHEVHVPELIGFGASVPAVARLGVRELAEVVAEWLAALGIGQAALVGHSLGGQLAVHMAVETDASPAALVLAAPSGLLPASNVVEAAAWLRGWLSPRCVGAPAFLPTIAGDALRCGPVTLAHTFHSLMTDRFEALLPQVRAPTLVVWGALDPLLPVRLGRQVAAAIPAARLAVLEAAAHNPMVDDPVAFNALLLEFLGAGRQGH